MNGVEMEEDRTVEMSEEQTDALVQVVLQGAYLNGVRMMQDAVLGNAVVSEAGKMDFIETLDMLSEEAPAEYRRAAAETGGMTVPGFMDVAAVPKHGLTRLSGKRACPSRRPEAGRMPK